MAGLRFAVGDRVVCFDVHPQSGTSNVYAAAAALVYRQSTCRLPTCRPSICRLSCDMLARITSDCVLLLHLSYIAGTRRRWSSSTGRPWQRAR